MKNYPHSTRFGFAFLFVLEIWEFENSVKICGVESWMESPLYYFRLTMMENFM